MEFKSWLYLERRNDNVKKLLDTSYRMLKFLYFTNYSKNETAFSFAQIPRELLDDDVPGKWCLWVKKFNPQFKPDLKLKSACGTEGCGLFIGNRIVIKFTYGFEEAKIATLIKGNPRFPVIDTVQYGGIFAIAMKELNKLSRQLETELTRAHMMVMSFLTSKDWIFDSNSSKEFKLWYQKIEASTDVENLTQTALDFSYSLLELMNIIQNETGYSLGGDWDVYNLGTNDQNQIQPFDFGYPQEKDNLKPKQAKIPHFEQ